MVRSETINKIMVIYLDDSLDPAVKQDEIISFFKDNEANYSRGQIRKFIKSLYKRGIDKELCYILYCWALLK